MIKEFNGHERKVITWWGFNPDLYEKIDHDAESVTIRNRETKKIEVCRR